MKYDHLDEDKDSSFAHYDEFCSIEGDNGERDDGKGEGEEDEEGEEK